MKYSVILKTCRKDPKFEWFFDSYYNEVKDKKDEFELIIIDSELWYNHEERSQTVKKIINNRFNYIHSEPKPTNWQGPYRKTKYNYFDAANSAGGALRTASGTACFQWGAGGSPNCTVDTSININGANGGHAAFSGNNTLTQALYFFECYFFS